MKNPMTVALIGTMLIFATVGLLTLPIPVEDGWCIVFDGPNVMHCHYPQGRRIDDSTIADSYYIYYANSERK